MVLLGPSAVGGTSEVAPKPGQEVLVGEYRWLDKTTGPLRAVLTPTGKKSWDLEMYFEFTGTPHTYHGTAKGKLDGKLTGEVTNEIEDRTFRFKGRFRDGTLTGTHLEVTPGRKGKTGTLVLRRESPRPEPSSTE